MPKFAREVGRIDDRFARDDADVFSMNTAADAP